MIHATEKELREYGDKIAAADKQAIERAVADLKAVLDGDDASAITAKTEILGQARMKLGEAMYRAQQAAAGGGEAGGPGSGGGQGGGGGDKVVDAEFEEVDPDKDRKAG
jgi:molecular chaperone DnaK